MDKDFDEATEQVIKRRRGGGKNSPVIGEQGVSATPAELSELGRYALEVFNTPQVDLTDPEAVQEAIQGYINTCIEGGCASRESWDVCHLRVVKAGCKQCIDRKE